MKKVLLMLAFTGLVGGLSAANLGDDKDKCKDKDKKECCKKGTEAKACCKKGSEAKACSGEKKADASKENKAEEKK